MERVLGSWESKCKGTGVEMSLACLKNYKKTNEIQVT